MKKSLVIIMCLATTGCLAFSGPVFAQQKTEKACKEEWRANKAANQAAKITEKSYVEKCRSAAANPDLEKAPITAPAKPPAPAAVTPTPAAPSPATAAPAQAPAPAARKMAPAKPATATSTSANQFATEAAAKARCPADTVVYVNLKSKIYHFAGHKDYGNLKNGTYMCEKDTAGAGARAAKNEKHP